MIDPQDFAEIVQDIVTPRLAEAGFTRVLHSDFDVRYQSGVVLFDVQLDARRSGELNLWTGRVEDSEPPFSLSDLLRATSCPASEIEGVELVQVIDPAVLRRLLTTCVGLLVTFGRPFLLGEPAAFGRARALRSERARRYTTAVRVRPILEAADAAWREGKHLRTAELLGPLRGELDPVHLKRLEIAERRVSRSRP